MPQQHRRYLLEIQHLAVSFENENGRFRVVDDINLSLEPGKILGLVGESGSGKSVTALAIMRLLPKPWARIDTGAIRFDGEDIVQLPVAAMRKLRGDRIAMIFQEPMTALNPVHRVGRQIAEVFALHGIESDPERIRQRSRQMLSRVGIADPGQCLMSYPHQISGGMRQRVMIAMALCGNPDLLIADEPTTALDVTVQAQLLELIRELQQEIGMGVLWITHDLGLVARLCDEVAVMYAGKIVEQAKVRMLFSDPLHPYTKGLLLSVPRLDGAPKARMYSIEGTVPSFQAIPPGCRFHDRCPQAMPVCSGISPGQTGMEGRRVWCHLYG